MSAVLKFSCKEKNQIIAHSLHCDGSLELKVGRAFKKEVPI
jgi:hypothetical protein